jgi:uncharacterized protein (DUF1778 family)
MRTFKIDRYRDALAIRIHPQERELLEKAALKERSSLSEICRRGAIELSRRILAEAQHKSE